MDSTQRIGEMPSTIIISNNDNTRIEQQKKGCFPIRYNLMFLGWLAAVAAYSIRNDLSIAMVAMVNQTFVENFKTNKSDDFKSFCPSPYNKSSSHKNNSLITGDIDWTPRQQGVVLAAFFAGYFCSQIPWGIIVQRFGGKRTVGFGLLVCGILSIVTPAAAEYSFVLTVIVRGLMGVTQGSVYPGLMSLIGKWVPLDERSKFSTVISTGSSGGVIASTYLTALFSEHDYLGGWRTAFYIFGAATCLWFIFWMMSVYNFPAEHPRISRKELNYIEASLTSATANEKDIKVPWASILKSVSIWSLCILMFCNSWLYYVQLTFMPTYMNVILGLDMNDNGIYSSLPYLAGAITSCLGGVIADCMIHRGVKINTTRKIMTTIGIIPETITTLTIAFLGCKSNLVITMFILTHTFGGFGDAGMSISIIDIAPRYAGVIYAIANCLANFSGMLAPLVTGYITDVEETLDQWKKVFFLASGLNIFGYLLFLTLAKVEKAPWSDDITENDEAKVKLIDSTSNSEIHTKNYGTIVS